MYLTYRDLAELFPAVKGIKDHELEFHTVSSSSSALQPKGIYIPFGEAENLKEAIEKGAVAALWHENAETPAYTPNHFPIFYTNDLTKGLKDIMELYINKLSKAEEKMNTTNFLISDEESLKENETTYDIAVMAERLAEAAGYAKRERRG
jgi:UDP-N-acetylmuramyl pentapeptide synthase